MLALAAVLCAGLCIDAPAGAQALPGAALPLPLTGAAYRVAQQGYEAFARHDYAAAERYAREAIRQRPDVASLRLLLANAQAAQRRLGDASRTLAQAQAEFRTDASLATRRRQIDAQIAAAAAPPRAAARGGVAAAPGITSPDHLTGQAYQLAQNAYAAYARHDYGGALRDANQAIALRPDVLRLRLLAIDAASAAGQPQIAWQAANDAAQRFGNSDELQRRRLLVGAQLAPKAAAAAQAARDRGDLGQAVANAREAVGYAPDQLGYRLHLFDLLAAQNDMPGLEQAASDALAAGVHPALMPYTVRGYARAAQGRFDEADADFASAARVTDASQRDQRVSRTIVADVWIAAGDPQRALDVLAPLKPAGDDTDALIAGRRFAAREALQAAGAQPGGASAANAARVATAARPVFDCTIDAYGSACDVYANDPGFAARRASVLAAQHGDKAAALAYARQAAEASPRDPQRRVELIDALAAAGDTAGAKREARAALDAGLLDGLPPLQAAYIAQRAGDSRRAFDYFAQADAAGELPPQAAGDAGYAAFRAHRDAQAAALFRRAIDYGTSPPDGVAPATLQQLQDLRNAHADVTRTWGFIASLSYRGAGLQPGVSTGTAPGVTNSWQTGLEAYWRPFGSLGDRMFEVYARMYQDFGAGGDFPSGITTALGAIGARAKPFESVNAIVAFERLIPIGSRAPADWLARLAYSGGFGTARRLDVPSWWTVQDYAEVGHYVTNGWNYGTGYLEAGRTYRLDRISPKLTVFPYGVVGADYDSSINHSIPLGAGVGVSTRYWFRDSFYNSPRSYIDVSLQYRWRISGDSRGGGVFFGTVLSY